MKRLLSVLLILVVLLSSVYYAAAEDIDVTSMSDQDLRDLRKAISDELDRRIAERYSGEKELDAYDLYIKYKDLGMDFRFQELIEIMDSGSSGLSDAAEKDIRNFAGEGISALSAVYFDRDEFTDRIFVFSENVSMILGDECFQVVPIIDYQGFCLLIAFPKGNDIFYVDEVYIKSNGEVFKSYKVSDPSFEAYQGEVWEYITVSGISLSDSGVIDLIGLRSNKSSRTIDIVPSEKEKEAIMLVWAPACAAEKIEKRLSNWKYGDDRGI